MKTLNTIISIMLITSFIAISAFAAEEVTTAKKQGEQVGKMQGRGIGQGCMMGGRMMGHGMGPGHMMRRGGMGRGRGRMGRGRMGGITAILRFADKLELSEAQKNELNEIATVSKKDAIAQKAECDIAKVDLQNLTKAENPNLGAVKEKLDEIALLESNIKFSRIKLMVDAKNVLTEEQKTALKKIIEDQRATNAKQIGAGRGAGRGAQRGRMGGRK